MSDDGRTTFTLDLDAAEAIEKALHLKEVIAGISEVTSLASLTKQLIEVGAVIGTVGLAFLGLKEAIEVSLDAEKIRAVNNQFEVLTRNAKISSETLKEGLEHAAGGLIEETELLRAANQALVTMGNSAARLPEILELSRKVAMVFGGDALERFKELNEAIESGRTRQLRHMGIVIDANQAYKVYAESIGASVNELSEHGRRQAILNAVLEKGNSNFKGVNASANEATNALKEFKVAVSEIKEAVVVAFGTYAESTVAKFFHRVAEIARNVKGIITGEAFNPKPAIIDLKGMKSPADQKKEDAGKQISASEAIDLEKRYQNQAKYEAQVATLREQALSAQLKYADTVAEVDQIHAAQKYDIEFAANAKIQELRANKELNDRQKDELVLAEREALNHKLAALDEELLARRYNALVLYVKHSQSAADGIARAFGAAAQKAKLDQQNWAEFGKRQADSFEKHAVNAFEAWGAGSISATDVVKSVFANMIADEAEAQGKMMMLASIWPPNPAGFAGGAALLALAGFLRSQAKGGSSGGGGGGGGDTGSGPQNYKVGYDLGKAVDMVGGLAGKVADGSSAQDQLSVAATSTPVKRAVNINIEGNYFDSDATRLAIVDIIRKAQDATDFNVTRLGS